LTTLPSFTGSCRGVITLAFDPGHRQIRVPVWLWRRVILDLRRRGGGRRESGAFLLGADGGRRVVTTSYICYDDLDPHAYQGGGIAFHAVGCAALWAHCRERRVEILADVHTHPGSGIGQSDIDQRNPMIPVAGHTAIIVPRFGHAPWWTLKGVGIYEYLGNFAWHSHTRESTQRVALTLL
jgi:hypothetical protein